MRFVMIDDDGKTEHVSVEDVVVAFDYYNRGLTRFSASETAEEMAARVKKRAEGIASIIDHLAAKRVEAKATATEDHPQL